MFSINSEIIVTSKGSEFFEMQGIVVDIGSERSGKCLIVNIWDEKGEVIYRRVRLWPGEVGLRSGFVSVAA
jgi:hypothetical protein